MSKKELNLEEIKNFQKIGEGKCAKIYTNENVVYKILKENSDSIAIYNKEMIRKLIDVQSDLCVFPNEILEDNNGKLLGYSMDFVPGKKLSDVISQLPFDQMQSSIKKAEQGITEISRQNVLFDDLHSDNIMWNTQTHSIQIIDTDFFKTNENMQNLNEFNSQSFASSVQQIISSQISQYGKTENESLIPFYDLISLGYKDGKKLSLNEYISNLKSVIENDFGRQFNNLDEIKLALQEKQDKIEEQQHLELITNNLTPKEKFIRFLAQNKTIRKLPFVNKIIDKQIKMLPLDVQSVVSNQESNTSQETTRKEENEFDKYLKNWPITPIQQPTNTLPKNKEHIKEIDNSDDLQL
jgi:hypothetical protein